MSEEITQEELAGMRRVADAATDGEWVASAYDDGQVEGVYSGGEMIICTDSNVYTSDADAHHIAKFDPPTVGRMLNRIERLSDKHWIEETETLRKDSPAGRDFQRMKDEHMEAKATLEAMDRYLSHGVSTGSIHEEAGRLLRLSQRQAQDLAAKDAEIARLLKFACDYCEGHGEQWYPGEHGQDPRDFGATGSVEQCDECNGSGRAQS